MKSREGLRSEAMNGMNFEELLPTISIRGRFAYGLGCIERACVRLGIKNPVNDQLLDMLWAITNRDDFVAWERELRRFFAQLRARPEGADSALGWDCLPPDQIKAFDQAVDRVIGMIIDVHMHTTSDNQGDDIPLLMEAIAFLERNEIALPDIGPVLRFTWSDVDWDGAKFPPSEVRDLLR